MNRLDTERLIEMVKEHEYLYDTTSAKYGDTRRKQEAWITISKDLGLPLSLCKKTWNSLRDTYRRAMKKKRRTSEADVAKGRKWKYEGEMAFLYPHLLERDPAPSIYGTSSDMDMEYSSKNLSDTEVNIENESSDYDPLCQSSDVEKKYRPKSNTSLYQQENVSTVSRQEQNALCSNILASSEMDDIEAFFVGIISTVKKFSPMNRVVAKSKIFSIVSGLEMDEIKSPQFKCDFPSAENS